MSKDDVKTRIEGGILEVIIDRPKANAIDLATSRLMGDTFKAFRDDPDLRVLTESFNDMAAALRTAEDRFRDEIQEKRLDLKRKALAEISGLLREAGYDPSDGESFKQGAAALMVAAHRTGHLPWRDAAIDLAVLKTLAEELRLAQKALGEITGQYLHDDLLGDIFSRFCIGK